MADERGGKPEDEARELREDSHRLLVGGATLGTFAVVTSALVGATCPMCVVVAPVMLGAGAVQRWRAVRRERAAVKREGTSEDAAETT